MPGVIGISVHDQEVVLTAIKDQVLLIVAFFRFLA